LQAVAVILLLISIGTTVGPVGAVVIMYRDNLPGLVIPPQIEDIMHGNSTLLAQNVVSENISIENETANLGPMGIVMPTFVSATFDTPTKTFTVIVNVTDFLNYDLTLNTINATVENSQDGNQLASIQLSTPMTIPAGQSALVTVSGSWTQAAEDYYSSHPDATSINVRLTNVAIDVNGITVQTSQPIDIGTIPLSLEGLH
jgi:hypothetical protein